jgi:hypothetical protein
LLLLLLLLLLLRAPEKCLTTCHRQVNGDQHQVQK